MATRILTEQQIEGILLDVIDLFLIPKFNSLGMNATGEWENNLKPKGNAIWGRDYTNQLVKGRQPGSYVPIEPLKRWAMAKFGYDEKRATGMAFAVSHTIKERGTTWYQKGGTDLISILKSPEVIRFINEQTGNFIKQQITGELTNYLKQTFK